jgi:ribosomal protein S18 acetylase RimI-like enzyme
MIAEREALLRRIDRYLNTVPVWRCDVLHVGSFDAFLNRGGGHPFLSYARPARPVGGDIIGDVETVRRAFLDRSYLPRWEYIDDLAPGLTAALVDAGFPAPDMRPLMVLKTLQRTRIPHGIDLRVVTEDEELLAAASVQRRGFGVPDEDDEAFDLKNLVAAGARVICAFSNGQPVAAGVHTPVEGVTELAGIATLEDHRCRGIGAALTAALALDGQNQGCELVFLSAGDEDVARIYRRAGFETIGYAADTMDAQ